MPAYACVHAFVRTRRVKGLSCKLCAAVCALDCALYLGRFIAADYARFIEHTLDASSPAGPTKCDRVTVTDTGVVKWCEVNWMIICSVVEWYACLWCLGNECKVTKGINA